MEEIDMYQCQICRTYYPLRDLDTTSKDLGLYICRLGTGCMEDVEVRDMKAPYQSLKVFRKKI